MNLKSFFRTLHLALGLVGGLVVMAVGLSGSVLTFREQIEHALYEPRVTPQTTMAPVQVAYAQALAVEPQRRRVSLIVLPEGPEDAVEFVLGVRGARSLKESDQLSVYVDPYTGAVVGQRHRNASFLAWLRDLHFALLGGMTGYKVNGWMAVGLIFISLTGLVLWLQTAQRGRLWAVKWSASWGRVTWDLHRLIGIAALLLLVIVAATGAYYPFRESVTKAWTSLGGSLPPRGAPTVTPAPGATPLLIDEIIAKARAASNARLAVLRPPLAPTQGWTATWHRDGEEGESSDSGLTGYFDPTTGQLLRLDDPAALRFSAQLLKAVEPVHFGKFAGLPSKLLWVLLGLTPGFLFVSGLALWLNRRRGARRAAATRAAKIETATSVAS